VNPDRDIYILDSFALLSYLSDEPGRGRLEDVLSTAEAEQCTLQLCIINFSEVLYIAERHRGLVKAQIVQALIEALPIEIVAASRNLVLGAAHIKANYALSYADAFVVELAQQTNGTILTGDPEFQTVEELVKIEWLSQE